jgi:hypothetical protein
MDVFTMARAGSADPAAGRARSAPCAGLRSALLHDWRHGFPLREAPYDLIGQALGASTRELLRHLRALQREGALSQIGPTWGPTVARVRWLCGVAWPSGGRSQPQSALAAVPGLSTCEWVLESCPPGAAQPTGWPAAWFTVVGLSDTAVEAQVAGLEAQWGGPVLRLPVVTDDTAITGAPALRGGPADDPQLAAWCECGLPLVRHPYALAARKLGRTQRDVLASLRGWFASGALQSLGMHATDEPTAAPVHAAAVVAAPLAGAALAALADRLGAEPGIGVVERLAPQAGLAYQLHIIAPGPPETACHSLKRALQRCGLAQQQRLGWHARRHHLQVPPRLFSQAEGGGLHGRA